MSGADPYRDLLRDLVAGKDLSADVASDLARQLTGGTWPPERVGAFLTALAAKGETSDELLGFARTLRQTGRKFEGPEEAGAIDLCGTGGAARPSYNISTVSAFVVAGAGQPVAKHGNSSARGPCGSSDLLHALGLPVTRSIPFAEASWKQEHLAFLHAPLYHTSTRAVAPVRQALGIRTIFNQLGPLTNPSGVHIQLVGSYSKEYARRAAPALRALGADRALFVHGAKGLDELSSQGRSWGWVFGKEPAGETSVDPLALLAPEERKGSLDPREPGAAAELAKQVLEGRGDGAVRGAVLLTSAAALWISGQAENMEQGIAMARDTLKSGVAKGKLDALQELARRETWDP